MAEDTELDSNPFLRALQTRYGDLYNIAQERRYLVCVPQSRSILGVKAFGRHFAETHVLRPSPYFRQQYVSVCSGSVEQTVQLADNGRSIATVAGFPAVAKVRVLREEAFYNAKMERFRVLVIEAPLVNAKEVPVSYSEAEDPLKARTTFKEWSVFLQAWPANQNALLLANELTDKFNRAALPSDPIVAVAELKCIAAAVLSAIHKHNKTLSRLAKDDQRIAESLALAVESYVVGWVHDKAMACVEATHAGEDQLFAQRLRALRDVTPARLGLDKQLWLTQDQLLACGLGLLALDALQTPHEKLLCLKQTVDALLGVLREAACDDTYVVGTDEMLLLLATVMATVQCVRMPTSIQFMQVYGLSCGRMQDLGYCVTSFDAACRLVSSGTLLAQAAPRRSMDGAAGSDVITEGYNLRRVSTAPSSQNTPSPRPPRGPGLYTLPGDGEDGSSQAVSPPAPGHCRRSSNGLPVISPGPRPHHNSDSQLASTGHFRRSSNGPPVIIPGPRQHHNSDTGGPPDIINLGASFRLVVKDKGGKK